MMEAIITKAFDPGLYGLNSAIDFLNRVAGLTNHFRDPTSPAQTERKVEEDRKNTLVMPEVVEVLELVEMIQRRKKFIVNNIKKRIHIYDPLTFKSTCSAFHRWLKEDNYIRIRVIKPMPPNTSQEDYLSGLIKDFLIQSAYYALEEKYIKYRIMNKLGTLDDNNIKLMEILDFIIAGVEKNDFKRLRYFREECKFKTFFSTVISSLLNDFWRRHYKIAKEVTKYEPDFEDAFDNPLKNPEEAMLHIEHQQDRAIAAKLLPEIIKQLSVEESFAIKMRFQKGMKISPIARALGRSDYKTKQFIKQTVQKISRAIAQKNKEERKEERKKVVTNVKKNKSNRGTYQY